MKDMALTNNIQHYLLGHEYLTQDQLKNIGLDIFSLNAYMENKIINYKKTCFLDYNIISLGFNCFPQAITCWNGLKITLRLENITFPFDLAVHPIKSIIEIINSNFSDYKADYVKMGSI